MMTLMSNGMPNIGKSLGLWVTYLLLIALFVAYIASTSLGSGTEYLTVFRRVCGILARVNVACGFRGSDTCSSRLGY